MVVANQTGQVGGEAAPDSFRYTPARLPVRPIAHRQQKRTVVYMRRCYWVPGCFFTRSAVVRWSARVIRVSTLFTTGPVGPSVGSGQLAVAAPSRPRLAGSPPATSPSSRRPPRANRRYRLAARHLLFLAGPSGEGSSDVGSFHDNGRRSARITFRSVNIEHQFFANILQTWSGRDVVLTFS